MGWIKSTVAAALMAGTAPLPTTLITPANLDAIVQRTWLTSRSWGKSL